MKFLCDVHISFKFIKFLNSLGYEATHVNNILEGFYSTDASIARYADEFGLIVVSKDIDFKNDLFIKGSPKKLIKISLGNIPNQDLQDIFLKEIKQIESISQSESFILEANPKGWTYIILKS
jgi:predicted nuclease of predicted toxin-antitoxin system